MDETAEKPALKYSRITPEGSWLVRRICAVILGAWLGGILLVSLGAPAAFRADEVVLRHPPPAHAAMLKIMGPDGVRDLLRYHAGEANNQMFAVWGTMQVAYGAAVTLLLLFFTDVGRWRLSLAAGLLALALFQRLYLIPAIANASRQFRSGGLGEAGRRFQMLHGSFAAFEVASALIGLTLLVLLLRRGRSRRRGRVGT
ncbi:MAG: hypothetical protein ACUVS7_08495 [Bryobacteraceae bacterium]